jgi:phospholipase/carboxylesterase
MKIGRQDICGIECLTVTGSRPTTGIIFLHGYGANMHDLFPLWELWQHESFSWYFPNGIQSLPMGYYGGRCWFSIDMAALENAMRMGTHRDMSEHTPPELDQTLLQLKMFLGEVATRHEKIILGGFSQGAMLATHLAMEQSLKIDGLILLSGALVAQSKFPLVAKGIPFYQSHGAQDPILSVDGARDLERRLHSLNFSGKLEVFQGGHEIPPQVIKNVRTFVDQFAD